MTDVPMIPYFQTSRYRVATMVELANIQPGDVGADLGSGDGRIAIAFAKAGVPMDAYEIDPERLKLTQENIKKAFISRHPETSVEGSSQDVIPAKAGISGSPIRSGMTYGKNDKIFIPTVYNKDFWKENLSQYSIVCCYPMPDIMGRLEHKLQQELKPGARVLLNYFPFAHWKAKIVKDNIFLYIK